MSLTGVATEPLLRFHVCLSSQGLDRCIGVAKEVARATIDAWFCLLSRGIFVFQVDVLCVQFHFFWPHLRVGGILPM